MIIEKLLVKNYKLLKDTIIDFNSDFNVLVGDNDSGKSTIMEAIYIALTGKLNHVSLERQLNASLFNSDVRSEYIKNPSNGLPEIIIELYCSGDNEDSEYKGSNNTLGNDCPGIRVRVYFDTEYETYYKDELENNKIKDIPIEFYKIDFHYFNGSIVSFRQFPISCAFIDASKSDTNNIQERFVNAKIDEYIMPRDQAMIDSYYRQSINTFRENDVISNFKKAISDKVVISNKTIGFDIKDENINSWKNQISIFLDNHPLNSVGYGSQNFVKLGIALGNVKEKSNCILIEEPENNLSYTNMSRLIGLINSTKAQIFITTHSSFVANKMSLKNIILINNGAAKSFKEIKEDTFDYFMKLPGYNTLRAVLSNKVILVEGPTEELLLTKYYRDKHAKMPAELGIDIICVNGRSFKRFLDIMVLLEKPVVLITDNDGDIEANIKSKYKDYSQSYISIFYETNEKLNTFEPSIFAANSSGDEKKIKFKTIIGCDAKSDQETIDYMKNNKTEWALKVFNSQEDIEYPEYVLNAIKKLG